MIQRLITLVPMAVFWVFGTTSDAFAEGRSEPWQMWFQSPASPVMEKILDFHNILFALQAFIVVFVLGVMVVIIIRFNAKSNPVPATTTHNTLLEVIWSAVPFFILIIIAIPSLKLLYYSDRIEEAEMTLKVTGNQWFWTYTCPDQGELTFDSILVPDDELKEGQPRLLAVDNPVVLPARTNIRLLFTSVDVIHNWAIPSLGLKLDTMPGRTNETWVNINAEGNYYGMCSELCGVNHGFMPIHVKAVSKDEFLAWVEKAKKEFAGGDSNGNGNGPIAVVAADARAR